jgi:hypothetical protein
MPDYTDHLIAEKYKTLSSSQRAEVEEFLTYIEANRQRPEMDAHYVVDTTTYNCLDVILGLNPPGRRNARINLFMAIGAGMVFAITSAAAHIYSIIWVLVLSWVLYIFGIFVYREHRLSNAW